MKIIFDLDYTIFDAKNFKEECLASFFGMSEQEFNDYYKKNFKDKGINYSAEKQMRDLGWSDEKIAAETKKFEEWLKKEIGSYLYPKAEELLKQFKERGDKIILVSFGDREFQRQKIANLKIGGVEASDFFDEIIISDNNKSESEELKRLKGEEILLVNDSVKEIIELKKLLGEKCEFFLVDGPYARCPEVEIVPKSLAELGERYFPERKEAVNELKSKLL